MMDLPLHRKNPLFMGTLALFPSIMWCVSGGCHLWNPGNFSITIVQVEEDPPKKGGLWRAFFARFTMGKSLEK
jgi:hypothetical protein